MPNVEDYHIIDRDSSHLLIIFCHGMPEMSLNGALVLSRSGDDRDIPAETLERCWRDSRQQSEITDTTQRILAYSIILTVLIEKFVKNHQSSNALELYLHVS